MLHLWLLRDGFIQLVHRIFFFAVNLKKKWEVALLVAKDDLFIILLPLAIAAVPRVCACANTVALQRSPGMTLLRGARVIGLF